MKTLGQINYDAYMDALVGANPIGHSPPPEKSQDAWEAAAQVVARDAIERFLAAREAAVDTVSAVSGG